MAREFKPDFTNEGESFRTWTPSFDGWADSWKGLDEDLIYGQKLLPWFADFLQALYDEGLSRKTFAQYRDDLWLLGGSIISRVSRNEEYQDDPLEKLRNSVSDDGIIPDGFHEMSDAELKAFDRLCRRFDDYLKKSKCRGANREHEPESL